MPTSVHNSIGHTVFPLGRTDPFDIFIQKKGAAHMKKQISIISAVVTTALIAGLTAMPVFAETQEKDETTASIQVYTGFSFQQEF